MVRFGVPGQNIAPTAYVDSRLANVPCVQAPRSPTVNDKKYPLWCEWRVTKAAQSPDQEGDFWKLIKFDSNGDAIWVKFNESELGPIITLSDTANTKVSPDINGNVQLEGTAGIDITSDPGNNKLVFALSGGSTAVDSFTVSNGTSPVVPDATGNITILDGQAITVTGGLNQYTIAADTATEADIGVVELASTAEVEDGTYGTTQVVSAGKITAMLATPAPIGSTVRNTGEFTKLAVGEVNNTPTSIVPGLIVGISSSTFDVNSSLRLKQLSTGTPTVGFGTALELQGQDAGGNEPTLGRLSASLTNASAGNISSRVSILVVDSGTQLTPFFVYPYFLKIAKGTTAQRPGSPAEGDFRGNTTDNTLEYYNGSAWQTLLASATKTSFTPALEFGGGSTGITYSTQTGYYIQYGDFVSFKLSLVLTNKGTDTGNMTISGLPVTPTIISVASVRVQNVTYTNQVAAIVNTSGEVVIQTIVSAGTVTTLTDTEFANTSIVEVSGSFLI